MMTEERLRKIRAVVLDVDGVLTDGGMYYGLEGEELKKFNSRDGMGVRLLRDAGIEVAIITGENSQAVARRAEKLKIGFALIIDFSIKTVDSSPTLKPLSLAPFTIIFLISKMLPEKSRQSPLPLLFPQLENLEFFIFPLQKSTSSASANVLLIDD